MIRATKNQPDQTMTDAHVAKTQTAFTETSIREGHSLASVQMWQSLCRRLAILGVDTESITNVMLSMSDQHGVSPLSICDRLINNGIKKLDGDCMEALLQLAEDEYVAPEGSDDTEQYPPATQPMTPPPEEAESVRGPEPKRTAKRKLFVDLTAEEEHDDF